jgi:hypothetical protein
MPTQSSYSPNPKVVHTRVDDAEVVLLSLATNRYYSLNETGSVIWEALCEGACPRDLATALEAEFEVTPLEAEARVAEFLDELRREGLLQPDEPATA